MFSLPIQYVYEYSCVGTHHSLVVNPGDPLKTHPKGHICWNKKETAGQRVCVRALCAEVGCVYSGDAEPLLGVGNTAATCLVGMEQELFPLVSQAE